MTFMSFADDTWSEVGDADRKKLFEQIDPVDGRLSLDASVSLQPCRISAALTPPAG